MKLDTTAEENHRLQVEKNRSKTEARLGKTTEQVIEEAKKAEQEKAKKKLALQKVEDDKKLWRAKQKVEEY